MAPSAATKKKAMSKQSTAKKQAIKKTTTKKTQPIRNSACNPVPSTTIEDSDDDEEATSRGGVLPSDSDIIMEEVRDESEKEATDLSDTEDENSKLSMLQSAKYEYD